MRAQRARPRRLVAALAVAATVGTATLFGATPASANTNFNNSCELTEACLYYWDNGDGNIWDYESTDTNLSNNWYPYHPEWGSGTIVDNRSLSFHGRGGSCTAVVGPNYGGESSQSWTIRRSPGSPLMNFPVYAMDQVSSLFWDC